LTRGRLFFDVSTSAGYSPGLIMADSLPAQAPVPLGASSGGRSSGKPWKSTKTATVFAARCFRCIQLGSHCSSRRSHLLPVLKTTKWEERMEKTKREAAIKKLQQELKDEKQADITRCAPLCSFGEQELTVHQEARDHARAEKGRGGASASRRGQSEGAPVPKRTFSAN
jgi:rRNA-processing protein CGR1